MLDINHKISSNEISNQQRRTSNEFYNGEISWKKPTLGSLKSNINTSLIIMPLLGFKVWWMCIKMTKVRALKM